MSLTRESCCHLGSFTDSSGVPSGPQRSVPVIPSDLFGVLGFDSKSRMYGHRPSDAKLSWQFFTYSHQSRDKFTLSLLKGVLFAKKVSSHTDTRVAAECDKRGGCSTLYSHTQGYRVAAVLFFTWSGSK